MEVPVLGVLGPRRQPPNEPHLLTVEEGGVLSTEKRASQIGGGEIIFGSRVGPEGSTLYTGRDASLDVDDAWPLEKQQIPRERGVFQRHKRMEISDRGGYRLDPGIVDVCLIQCRHPVG